MMRRLLCVLVVLAPAFAGCFGPPEIPDDATTDSAGSLHLSAWTQMRGERLELHAVLQNDGESVEIRTGCGHPWISNITGPSGTVAYVEVQEPAGCAPYWDELRTGGHLTFLHSWDFQNHDPATGESWPAAGGAHEWSLSVQLRDDTVPLTTTIPIDVACGPDNPCGLDGVTMNSTVSHDEGWRLAAAATNHGPHTYRVSSICAPVWTDSMSRDGDAVQHRDASRFCLAYGVRDWLPGETLTFNATWDGRLWNDDGAAPAPAGDYTWSVTLHTLEPSRSMARNHTITVQ